MHKLFLFFLLCLTFNVTANTPLRVVQWQKVPGLNTKDITVYVDVSTVKSYIKNDIHHGFGLILFHSSRSTVLEISGNTMKSNMFARYYVVDCNNALAASLSDFYFDQEKLPVVTDEPLIAFEYPKDKLEVFEVSKEHSIYKTLCPNYI